LVNCAKLTTDDIYIDFKDITVDELPQDFTPEVHVATI
jgi:hypothetical protein